MTCTVLLVALFLAAPVWAQSSTLARPSMAGAYTLVVAGNAADLWTTQQAFRRGAVEGNGLAHGRPIVRLSVSKAAFTGAVLLLMRKLERHGHPTAARVLGYVDGGVTFGAAAWNHTRER